MKKRFKQISALVMTFMLSVGIPASALTAMADDSMPVTESTSEEISETSENPELSEEVIIYNEELPSNTELYAEENDSQNPETLEAQSDPQVSLKSAAFNESHTTYTIELQNVSLKDGERVTVPVWSEKGGQDDIIWNSASAKADGTVEAVINISDYKDPGKYFADFYKIDKDGVYSHIFSFSFDVGAARSAKVTLAGQDKKAGTAVIKISDIDSPAGVKRVVVPTWSKSDQSNIHWYEASAGSDGAYEITVNISNHKYDWAKYYSDVYVTDNNGFMNYADGITTDFSVGPREPVASVDEDGGTCTVTISADDIPPGISRMTVPVWSEAGGQDDLRWIDMTADDANNYSATFSTAFLKHSGNCFADVYASSAGGAMVYMGSTTFEIKGASAQNVTAAADQATGTFTVTVSGIKNLPKDASVIVPVWCADDQSDIYWYTAEKQGSDYVAKGNVGKHNFAIGTYKADVYAKSSYMAYMGSGTMKFAASNGTFTLTDKYESISVREQSEYTGRLSGVLIPGGFSKVMAAVWSEKGGQDDIIWYTMEKESDGSLVFDLPIRNHKTAGAYFIHIYAVTKSGNYQFVSAYNDLLIDPVNFNADVTVQNADAEAGTFQIKISNYTSVSGLSAVSVPVWTSQDGQDDIRWYSAVRQPDGSFIATVNAANHKNQSGVYMIDAYATSGNGQFAYAGGTSYNFKLADNTIMISGGLDYVAHTISIRNPTKTPVRFAVWSTAGGQDDLTWIDASNKGNGIWSAAAHCGSFKSDGTFMVHAYSGNTILNVGTFTWNAKTAQRKLNSNQQMYNLAQGFSSSTQYLILINRSLHRVAVYQGSKGNWNEIKYWACVVGKPSTPTPAGTYQIGGRFDWFGEGHKCWWATQITGYYYFHTQIYYWDDAPRRILDGTMDAAASMGCVRLHEPNAWWIYTTIPRGTTVHIF